MSSRWMPLLLILFLTGYTGFGAAVTIPDKNDGIPVTDFKDNVLQPFTNLTTGTIPTNVTGLTIPTSIAKGVFLCRVTVEGWTPSIRINDFPFLNEETVQGDNSKKRINQYLRNGENQIAVRCAKQQTTNQVASAKLIINIFEDRFTTDRGVRWSLYLLKTLVCSTETNFTFEIKDFPIATLPWDADEKKPDLTDSDKKEIKKLIDELCQVITTRDNRKLLALHKISTEHLARSYGTSVDSAEARQISFYEDIFAVKSYRVTVPDYEKLSFQVTGAVVEVTSGGKPPIAITRDDGRCCSISVCVAKIKGIWTLLDE